MNIVAVTPHMPATSRGQVQQANEDGQPRHAQSKLPLRCRDHSFFPSKLENYNEASQISQIGIRNVN